MAMNPALMMAAITALSSLSGLGGSKGEMKSGFSSGQRSLNDMMTQLAKGQNYDVTNSPLYGQGTDFMQSMFNDPEFFKKFEEPALRQFNEQIIPGMANRFAGMGSGGATGSTGARNLMAREGMNLSSNLAAQRGGMQMNMLPQMLQYAQQPVSNAMNMYGMAMNQPMYNMYQPPSGGMFGPMAGQMMGGFGAAAGQGLYNKYFGG